MPSDLFDAARAAEILQSRWEQDPLRLWVPTPKQKMFLECKKPEVALLGANRSGKSDPLAALVASLARFGNPNPGTAYGFGGRLEIIDRAMSIWVIGLSERLVKEGIQGKIITTGYTPSETHPAFIPPAEVDSWNINDQTWRLKNGSIIGFKTADAGRDVFQSAGRDLVAFDEICDWEVYKEATFRAPGGNRRLLIRLAATLLPPLGVIGGVSWYYPKKIRPWWDGGNKENRTGNPDPNLDIFTLGIRDNPYLAREEIDRMAAIFTNPNDPEARIRLDGELIPTVGGSLAYSSFNRAIHIDKQLLPERRDFRLPLNLCVDFNVTPCIWVVGQKIDGTWGFFDEIVTENCNIGIMCEEFRRRYPTHGAKVMIYGDQTGAVRSVQSGESHYWIIGEAFKGYPVPVDIQLPTRNPLVPDRLNAVNRALSGPDGRIGLLFGPHCVECVADCEEVLKDDRGGIKKTHHTENPYFRRTHAMDAVGYGISFVDPVPRVSVADPHRIMRHIPNPGYLKQSGRQSQFSRYPDSFDANGRLRMGPSGNILAPKRRF